MTHADPTLWRKTKSVQPNRVVKRLEVRLEGVPSPTATLEETELESYRPMPHARYGAF